MSCAEGEVSDTLFRTILHSVDSKDTVISQTWLETVLDIMKYISQEILLSEAIPFALSKTHISKPVEERIISCQLLGGVVQKLDASVIKKEIVPVVQSLCQDVNAEVRASMCRQLPQICSAIRMEIIDLGLLPFLIELTNDDDTNVCLESLNTVLDVIPFLSRDVVVTIILPILKNIFKRCQNQNGPLLLNVAKNIGRLFSVLEGICQPEDGKWLLSEYMLLLKFNVTENTDPDVDKEETNIKELSVQCLQHCASNFGTVASACCKIAYSHETVNTLYKVLLSFCNAENSEVRMTIASIFDEVSSVFKKVSKSVLDLFLKLLTSDDECVRLASIRHVTAVFADSVDMKIIGHTIMDNTTVCCIQALVNSVEKMVPSTKWRQMVQLLGHLQHVFKHLPPNVVYNFVTDKLFVFVKQVRQLPCRIALVRTLLIVMNQCQAKEQKSCIQKRIVEELFYSASFYDRSLYIKVCADILDIFHCPVTRSQFLTNLIILSDDAILNIRISLCIAIPELMMILKKDEDDENIDILNKVIFALENERNRDVSEQVTIMLKKLSELDTPEDQLIGKNEPRSEPPLSPPPLPVVTPQSSQKKVLIDVNGNNACIEKVEENHINVRNIKKIPDEERRSTDSANDAFKRNSWTSEKDFVIDTGIPIRITSSKIPSLCKEKSSETVPVARTVTRILQRPKNTSELSSTLDKSVDKNKSESVTSPDENSGSKRAPVPNQRCNKSRNKNSRKAKTSQCNQLSGQIPQTVAWGRNGVDNTLYGFQYVTVMPIAPIPNGYNVGGRIPNLKEIVPSARPSSCVFYGTPEPDIVHSISYVSAQPFVSNSTWPDIKSKRMSRLPVRNFRNDAPKK